VWSVSLDMNAFGAGPAVRAEYRAAAGATERVEDKRK